jgi:hypothetical protein
LLLALLQGVRHLRRHQGSCLDQVAHDLRLAQRQVVQGAALGVSLHDRHVSALNGLGQQAQQITREVKDRGPVVHHVMEREDDVAHLFRLEQHDSHEWAARPGQRLIHLVQGFGLPVVVAQTVLHTQRDAGDGLGIGRHGRATAGNVHAHAHHGMTLL